jgi:hypothetical protein
MFTLMCVVPDAWFAEGVVRQLRLAGVDSHRTSLLLPVQCTQLGLDDEDDGIGIDDEWRPSLSCADQLASVSVAGVGPCLASGAWPELLDGDDVLETSSGATIRALLEMGAAPAQASHFEARLQQGHGLVAVTTGSLHEAAEVEALCERHGGREVTRFGLMPLRAERIHEVARHSA